MGLKIGRFLGKVARTVGTVAKVAAPILAATGVGLPLAAGIGVGGGLLSKVGKQGALGSALAGGAGALAGSAARSSGVLGKVAQLMRGGAPGTVTGTGAGNTGTTFLDRVGQVTRTAADALGVHNVRDLAELGLGAGAAAQGASSAASGERARSRALDIAEADLAARQPLRQAALQALTAAPTAPREISLVDPSNVFARPRQVPTSQATAARSLVGY